jgi:hypothetical protein
MKCDLHPKYKGINKPTSPMAGSLRCNCWQIYYENHADEKHPNFITGKMMSLNDWRAAARESAKNLIKVFGSKDVQKRRNDSTKPLREILQILVDAKP